MAAVIASGTVTLSSGSMYPNTCQSPAIVTATRVAATDVVVWAYASALAPTDRLMQVSVYVAPGSIGFTRCNFSHDSTRGAAVVINWRVIR